MVIQRRELSSTKIAKIDWQDERFQKNREAKADIVKRLGKEEAGVKSS